MPDTVKSFNIRHLLCSDIRFSLPDVVNDHCWEVGATHNQPSVLSISTTYGLRASRMQVFPSFTLEDHVIQDPAQFSKLPEIRYVSTNFITLALSPFQDIDVIYNLWVPTPHMVVGEITFFNQTKNTRALEVDWQVNLTPLEGGSPMKHTQVGLSTVLQGECADLFPVFYLPGDVNPSKSATPGLSSKYLLMPASSRHSTWALASLSTPDASFQQARQYSSKSLDVEKLRIEMADKRDLVQIAGSNTAINQALELSSVRTLQLIMPPVQNFKFPTFIHSRGLDGGYYPRTDLIEINTEWSGQTLPDIWLMAQSLLPGNPEVVQGFIANSLSRFVGGGKLDHRVGVKGAQTGHAALPVLAQLVTDLHPSLNNLPWLEEIYPELLAFLKSWLDVEHGGTPIVRGLTHPVQLGAHFSGETSPICASDMWMRLSSNNTVMITSLLIREISGLLQISRWLNKNEEIEWLEKVRDQLVSQLLSFWDEKAGHFRHPEISPEQTGTGLVIHTYKRNGQYKPRRKLPVNGKIYLRVTGEGYLPVNFSCTITGLSGEEPTTLSIRPSNLVSFGNTRVFISDQAFSRVERVEISNLPAGFSVEIGQPNFVQQDLTQLLSLYAGVLTTRQANHLLRKIRVRNYLGSNGLSLLPSLTGETTLQAPPYLAGLIVEGLVRYGKVNLAEQVFQHHFTNGFINNLNILSKSANFNGLNLEDLVPARLFLKLRGVVRFTGWEVILSHFIKQKRDAVTVQYNKIELRLKPFLAEIHTQTGEVIYLNRAGPNRVLLD